MAFHTLNLIAGNIGGYQTHACKGSERNGYNNCHPLGQTGHKGEHTQHNNLEHQIHCSNMDNGQPEKLAFHGVAASEGRLPDKDLRRQGNNEPRICHPKCKRLREALIT